MRSSKRAIMSAVSASFTSLHFDAWPQLQLDAGDEPKQPVAADRQPEQVRVLAARATPDRAVGAQQFERAHLLDEGLEREAAAVSVAR